MRALILATLFLASSSLFSSSDPVYEMNGAIKARDHKELNRLIQNYAKHVTLRKIESFARQHKNEVVLRVAAATRALQQGEIDTDLRHKQVFSLCLFIETQLPYFIKNEKYYLARGTHGLVRAIEYDPETKRAFVHLGWRDFEEIGRGTNKIVTKAIMYEGAKSEIVARCEQQIDIPDEWKFTRYLQGTPGVVDSKAFTSYTVKDKKYYNVYAKLYRPGPLSRILRDDTLHFTLKDKVKIALDIARGLDGMQKKNVVHRDFCGQNCLINISKTKSGKKKLDAVIVDFGCAGFATEAKGSRAQGHSCYTAPEGIFRSKLDHEDYFKTDLFAAGALLYCLQIEDKPEWLDPLLIREGRKSPEYRFNKHVWLISEAIKKEKERLLHKQKELQRVTRKDEFELIILKMIDPNPQKRGTAAEHLNKLEKLYKRFAE